ncbi:MAG: UDP-N-acetylmuramate--L-alanine ligase, partial [Chloroflexi bacterium]
RFEVYGEVAGVTVIDDYAHHPTEVQATIAAAQQRYPGRRVVVYVQPHTFSRTRSLWERWPEACRAAAIVLIGDIYPAREQGDPAKLATELVAYLVAQGVVAHYGGGIATAAERLVTLIQPGDVVLVLGAGDSNRVAAMVIAQLRRVQAEA